MANRPDGRPRSRRWQHWWLVASVVILALGAGLTWRAAAPRPPEVLERASSPSAATMGPAVARREMRPTLDPAGFVGKAARAHQVAREIPDVLDQLYCYCECDRHLGHKSLLSCYTDGHAAT